ncbi:Helix-turn-helix domain, partial [Dysosmobacter welbionis]
QHLRRHELNRHHDPAVQVSTDPADGRPGLPPAHGAAAPAQALV